MKKTIILFGLIAVLSSCNVGRIAELEAENMVLKATVERLTEEAMVAQLQAERAMRTSMEAQRMAEEQAEKAQVARKNDEK
jgi:hypothetical protein